MWRGNPNAQLCSIARAGGIVPDSEAGMPSDAFYASGAFGRMDAEGRVDPHGEYVASLLIDLAIASSKGAPTLLTVTISIAGDDAPSRWHAQGELRFVAT